MLAAAAVLALGFFASNEADAARLGGGRSFGRQSQSIQRQQSTPVQPMSPSRAQQATPSTPSTPPAATPQPSPNRWLGPIAGLAAGLGIAALLSHFGLGGALAGAMANLLIIAALALVAVGVFRLLARRRADGGRWYTQGARPGLDSAPHGAWPQQVQDMSAAPSAGIVGPAQPSGLPAGFDTDAFLHNATVYFVRMQSAWDKDDLDEIREFTTPEMFAEIKVDLDERGATPNHTDVVQLDAEIVSVEESGDESLATVRFHGLIRETAGAAAEPFSEMWTLSRQAKRGEGWLLAGIQQVS
ncbi:hypothetical protein BCY88_08890 [Paraburkholderia fungorum]|uniref:Tim44-like domain-containing protein n=2 Tax=Paraburkholderia fungorum TaxID=134537 RepID=A0A420FS64_9BURK|nr:TIM44-like domain-containing protein [Paraburkholderia fungorum]RKF35745.1 hypothetical protein BCY88_08890 [Paraburkholderia fungorum]